MRAARVGPRPAGRSSAACALAWKRQGLPGSVAQPALEARLSTLDVIGDARAGGAGRRGHRAPARLRARRAPARCAIRPASSASARRTAATSRCRAARSSTWSRPLGRHRGTAGRRAARRSVPRRDRDGARAAARRDAGAGSRSTASRSSSCSRTRSSSRPPLRLDVVRTAPAPLHRAGRTRSPRSPPRWDVVPSPRLAARARLAEDVAVKGSAGWYARLPTLLELFGDRGTIVGSPELRPERGPSADLGVVWAPARPAARTSARSTGSSSRRRRSRTRATDTIALISTAGFVARAENVGATQTLRRRARRSRRGSRARCRVTASYTRLVTEQRAIDPNLRDKALPRDARPPRVRRAPSSRRRALGRRASLWIDVAVQSTAYLDRANLRRVPARALVGAGARVELGRRPRGRDRRREPRRHARRHDPAGPRRSTRRVRTALADVAGFPLPGRSFYLSLDWTY